MGTTSRIWIAGIALMAATLGCTKPAAPVVQVVPAPVATEPTIPANIIPPPTVEVPVVVVVPPKPDAGPSSTIRPTVPKTIIPVGAEAPKPAEPITGVQLPKPAEPPKVDPPKPTDPSKTEDPPKEPKKYVYPTSIDGKDLNAWIKQLNPVAQPDPQQREAALRTLPQFGPEARKPSIMPVTNMIYADGEDPGVRIAAITIITNIGYETREQIKPVVAALRTCLAKTGNGSIVRLHCLRSLMSFGPEAVAAIPEIRAVGNDASWETRQAVATALGRVGAPPGEKEEPNDAAAKYLLNTLLKDLCAVVRMEAIQALLQIGPPKPKNPLDYIKDIKHYLEPVENRLKPNVEKDKGILCWLYLLNIMYDDRVLPEHLKKIAFYIKFPDSPMVRMHALNACAALGSKAAPVIPQIADALSYDQPELVIAAMSALAQIGLEARGTAPELEKIKAGSKDPVKPPDAHKDWKPDPTLRLVAEDALLYVTGKKKLPEEVKKDK